MSVCDENGKKNCSMDKNGKQIDSTTKVIFKNVMKIREKKKIIMREIKKTAKLGT